MFGDRPNFMPNWTEKSQIMRNLKYTLPAAPEATDEQITILGIDPGSSNQGISCIRFNKKKQRFRVLANATMTYPLNDLRGKEFQNRLHLCINEIDHWVQHFGVQVIIAERFQSRGLKGATGEYVACMLGALAYKYPVVRVIPASQWKNAYQRLYEVDLKDMYKVVRTVPHQLDATLIARHGAVMGSGNKEIPANPERLIDRVNRASLHRLVNRQRKEL